MHTGLQLRSQIKSSGELELSLDSIDTPHPGPDEVLIRIEASPLNPSDLGLLFGAADMSTAKASGTAERPIVTARVPEGAMRSMAGRLDASMPVGNEARAWSSMQARPLRRKLDGQDRGCHRRRDVLAVPLHFRRPVPGPARRRHAC